jgi:hypothetical protein
MTLMCEYTLRGIKSMKYDGTLHLSTPSINNVSHPKYGWISPSDLTFTKDDHCYGEGKISYNAQGFRAPDISESKSADIIVCILGDSIMQGYQIPDGGHLPQLLSQALESQFRRPYVLPLAVGGYGQAQQWLLFKDFCEPLRPHIVVQHWSSNDPTNNSYRAERFGGAANNNARRRPYYEDGKFVIRAPYPVSLGVFLDGWLIMKLINTFLLRQTVSSWQEQQEYQEEGWAVAKHFAYELKKAVGDRAIALVARGDHRAIEMYHDAGIALAVHPNITTEETCAPRDSHPTTAGHKKMLDALLPALVTRASW